jgi:hypothetical protein
LNPGNLHQYHNETNPVMSKLKNTSGLGVMVFNTTFNNISVISWQSVLLVEEIGETAENP